MSDCVHCGLGPMSHAFGSKRCPEPENGGWGSTKYEPMTIPKEPSQAQEGPYHPMTFNHPNECEYCVSGEDKEFEAQCRNKAYAKGLLAREKQVGELVEAMEKIASRKYGCDAHDQKGYCNADSIAQEALAAYESREAKGEKP